MRIDYIKLVGYKRFRLANIHTFEASFPEAVTMIISESGKGKSSLLSQLNPTPAVRTDFEKDGYKEIHITHKGSNYVLISDFSNKAAPHSFIMNDTELNIGHTTDVQNELVLQHFNISSLINNLVYGKTKLTELSKSERKNLFLSIIPMELELVVNAHKKVMNHLRDCKANLQMLHARKIKLEGEMIGSEVLTQNINTKNKLLSIKQNAGEMILLLQQHLSKIAEDKDYNTFNENEVTSAKAKLNEFKKSNSNKFIECKDVPRDDSAYSELKDNCINRLGEIKSKQQYLTTAIDNINSNINKYTEHLEASKNNPITALENSILELDKELATFTNLPDKPIDISNVDLLRDTVSTITDNILIIKDSGVTLQLPDKIHERYSESCTLKTVIASETDKRNKLVDTINYLNETITNIKNKASIPENCVLHQCGLRQSITDQINSNTARLNTAKQDLIKAEACLTDYNARLTELNKVLAPYSAYKLVSRFNDISRAMRTYFNYTDSDDKLIDTINIRGTAITADLTEMIDSAIAYRKYTELKNKRESLNNKLNVLVQSASLSTEFINSELIKMKAELAGKISELNELRDEYTTTAKTYANLMAYKELSTQAVDMQSKFDGVERKLIVNKAYEYWDNLRARLVEYSYTLDSQLRSLETLVETQQRLRFSYENEILAQISKIEEDKKLYEKLEMSLSPNSGIPHRYMVKYLNTLINNVNHFLNKIWAYPLVVSNIDEHDTIDYTLPVKVGAETNRDISMLSDGQSEIMNLVWTLTILLQMKLLNNMPFYADEITRCMDSYHRNKTMQFLNSLLDNKLIEQCFIINHFVSVSEGFKNCNIVCLSTDNLNDIPESANEHVNITCY